MLMPDSNSQLTKLRQGQGRGVDIYTSGTHPITKPPPFLGDNSHYQLHVCLGLTRGQYLLSS